MRWNPFKRNSQDLGQAPAMPPELTDYYNAEHRQRRVVTWLLGIATLAVTVALAFALFLGARWVIHKVKRGDNTPQPTTVQTTQPAAPAPSQPTNPNQSGTSQTAQNSTSGSTQSAQNTTPKASSATTTIPNTGPGDVLAIWLGATVLGALVHRRFARR